MISGISQFKADLTKFYEEVVPANHLKFQKKIAQKLFELIITRNSEMPKHPVLTGWARANWDARAFGFFQRPPTAPIGTRPDDKSGTVLSTQDVSGEIAKAKPYGIIWIYNNVPYIVALENGHSKQAPTGMVEGALHDLQEFISSKGFL